jgi:hypothetical protein
MTATRASWKAMQGRREQTVTPLLLCLTTDGNGRRTVGAGRWSGCPKPTAAAKKTAQVQNLWSSPTVKYCLREALVRDVRPTKGKGCIMRVSRVHSRGSCPDSWPSRTRVVGARLMLLPKHAWSAEMGTGTSILCARRHPSGPIDTWRPGRPKANDRCRVDLI